MELFDTDTIKVKQEKPQQKKKRFDDSDSDEDFKASYTKKSKTSPNTTATRSNRPNETSPTSGSSALPKFATVTALESQYHALEEGEKKSRVRGAAWTDDEVQLILLALFNKMKVEDIASKWPMKKYPRTIGPLKMKIASVRAQMALVLKEVEDTDPQSNGTNAKLLLTPLLLPNATNHGSTVLFGYPTNQFSNVLVGIPSDKSVCVVFIKHNLYFRDSRVIHLYFMSITFLFSNF